jgi:hypothetical protein
MLEKWAWLVALLLLVMTVWLRMTVADFVD